MSGLMPALTQESMAFLDFQKFLMKEINQAFWIPARLLSAPPRRVQRFRFNREISARRARKLRKRGEDCFFTRWTVNGKCRYAWGGPPSRVFTARLGPWQNPLWRPPTYTSIGRLTDIRIDLGLDR